MNKVSQDITSLLVEEAANQLKRKYRSQIKNQIKAYKFPADKFKQLIKTAEKRLIVEIMDDLWRVMPKGMLQEKLKKELIQRIKKL